MKLLPRLLAVLVGTPHTYGSPDAADPMEREWTTAFFKEPVGGPVGVCGTHVTGDRQADTKNHGGPEQAVLAYAGEHYAAWREELDRPDFPFGAFGENLTLSRLTEESTCVGDVFEIGDAMLQVSKPRKPCWKISRRWHLEGLTDRVRTTGRSGWYLRVVLEGTIEAGQTVRLIERPCPEWSVARVAAVMRDRVRRPGEASRLAACPYLAPDWRTRLQAAQSVDTCATTAGRPSDGADG